MRTLGTLRRLIEQNPNDAEAHWQLGCMLAYQGKWQEAWPEMEWRMKGHVPSMRMRAEYPKPDWDGCTRKVLVYQDQGTGDLFQYVRYVFMMAGCNVILECKPEACRLLKNVLENRLQPEYYKDTITVIPRGQPLPEYEQVIPICSLANYFQEIPETYHYLWPTDRTSLVQGRIGVVWAGNPEFQDDAIRSCSPEEFMVLEGSLVSLMVRRCTQFLDLSSKIKDFADTAAIIESLDCVVSVDTAVAHLAGAMNKKVYLALPYEHDWRWGQEKTTPWYPSMKLFRQPKPGDWKSVFQQIKKEIENDK